MARPSTSDTVTLTVVEAGAAPWWSADHPYRLPISVAADGVARQRRVALVDLDFAPVLAGGALDRDALRLVEYDAVRRHRGSRGAVPVRPRPRLRPHDEPDRHPGGAPHWGYPRVGRAHLSPLPRRGRRRSAPRHRRWRRSVGPAELTVDEGQTSYRIATEIGEWYYHKNGGGFSSLDDVDGNDWIGYQQGGGSSGEYRGIPNLVFPEGHFHPGSTSATTRLVQTRTAAHDARVDDRPTDGRCAGISSPPTPRPRCSPLRRRTGSSTRAPRAGRSTRPRTRSHGRTARRRH